jgi:ATP-dependent RNA helicase HelY
VTEYQALAASLPKVRSEDLVGRLLPGDVIDIPGGPRQGRYLIIRRIRREGGKMKLLAIGSAGRSVALGEREVVVGTCRRARLELPKPVDTKSRRFQQDAMRLLRKVPWEAADSAPPLPAAPAVDHPVATCPDLGAHLRWTGRAARTRQKLDQHRAELRRAGVGIVEDFQAIEDLLGEFGYLDGWKLTPRGERLRFLYNELDLLLAEALERGLMWGLSVPELAAFISCFVYEARSEVRTTPIWPTAVLADRWDQLMGLSDELVARERDRRLPPTRQPDPGFAGLAYEWASGLDLEDLSGLRVAAGDFVRVSRQLVDLTRQIRDVSPDLVDEAAAMLAAIDRGVVAAMGVR